MANNITSVTAPPTQQDILNFLQDQIAFNTNCVKIGSISAYNYLTNTAEITINSQVELVDGRSFSYPLLVDCPVFRLVGGSSYITMPIAPGDECLVVFNDFDIDNWFYSGKDNAPATSRKHSISDGFCFVGFQSLPNIIPALPGIIEMFAGTNKVAIGNATVSLKYIIDQTLSILENALVQVGASTYPFTSATIAQFSALKTQADLLLDQGSAPL